MKELLTILGLVNYLNRYLTKLAELTAPLRELNKKTYASDKKIATREPWMKSRRNLAE